MIYGDAILLQMLNPREGEQVAYATCTTGSFLFTAAIKVIWIYFVFCSLVTITCQNFMGNSMLFKPTCSCRSIYTHIKL